MPKRDTEHLARSHHAIASEDSPPPGSDQPGSVARSTEPAAAAATLASARPRAVTAAAAAAAAAAETAANTSRSPAVAVEIAGHPASEPVKAAPFVVGNGTRVRTARRILQGADILNPESGIPKDALWQQRTLASTRFHLELDEAKTQIALIGKLVPDKPLPERLFGTVKQPTGAPAAHVQVETEIARSGAQTERRLTVTSEEGNFSLPLPAGRPFPDGGIKLRIQGASRSELITVNAERIAVNGLVGDVKLAAITEPLPTSIVGSLESLLPSPGTVPASDLPEHTEQPTITMGEDGGCLLSYSTNTAIDRFPFSVFVRLVEPRTSIVTPSIRLFPPGGGKHFFPVADYFPLSEDNGVAVSYVDRVPVDQPISVDGFRDQLIGVGDGTTVSSFETVAMAGTLGLGYVLRMSQLWTPQGLTLGNLVYSLPLAPGEQQRVAVFERRDTSSVFETEALSVDEQQRFSQLTDATTDAIFTSAFDESQRGGSSFRTSADSWGAGGSIIIFSAGGGGSSSSGSSSSWMQGHRDFASRAVEDVHTSLQRQAAASRRLFRTGMRLATSTENVDVTTKIITNHNKTRALTLQYWEVQRLFEVTTHVEGVELVCLVPLEIVRFLPPGQPLVVANIASVDTRAEILQRYGQILKHADILDRRLPRAYRNGLTLLRQFAADPTAEFQPAGSAAEDVIHLEVSGTFLPFEEIYVSGVTRRGTRVGPVRLTGAVDIVPEVQGDLANSFPTQDALMGYLRGRRSQSNGYTLVGDLAVPPSLARNDIVGFEISRRFRPFDYDLVNPAVQALSALAALGFSIPAPSAPPDHMITGTVRLSPQKLEQELGGPFVWNFMGKIHSLSGGSEETYVQGYLPEDSRQQLPTGGFPIPAIQLAPVLRYGQLLEIEQMTQHVVRNTVTYSKAVWQSLTPEERAIMLEGFTIGVPAGGVVDESQTVPLLNCVENRVLGYYGNSMIMPFIIPRRVADDMGITSGQIQDTLTKFHETAFSPPKSVVALPTRGVLGEAVLGHCPSAEKIDLTRFWNWSDSPGDSAPEISPVTVPTTQPSLTAGMQGPTALTGVSPLINNINANPTVPGADGALLQALAQAASAEKSFGTDITGATVLGTLLKNTQDIAGQGRADAFKITRDLNAQAMATVGNIVGGIYAKNPTAGSEAAAAVYGTTPPKSDASAKKTDGAATGTGGSGSTGTGGSGGTGSGGSGGTGSGGSGGTGSGGSGGGGTGGGGGGGG